MDTALAVRGEQGSQVNKDQQVGAANTHPLYKREALQREPTDLRQLPGEQLDRGTKQGAWQAGSQACGSDTLKLENALAQRLPAPPRVAEGEVEPGGDREIEQGGLPNLEA